MRTVALRSAGARRPRASVVRIDWPGILLMTLAATYLALGVTAGGMVGLLGVLGAIAVSVAVGLSRLHVAAAVTLLVVATLPFAVATWWSVVTPATAALMLVVGVPTVVGRHTRAAASSSPSGSL